MSFGRPYCRAEKILYIVETCLSCSFKYLRLIVVCIALFFNLFHYMYNKKKSADFLIQNMLLFFFLI